jgi:transglutaminase-like putative cysteine protease
LSDQFTGLAQKLRIEQGWLPLAAIALMVFSTAWSMEKAAWVNGLSVLGTIAIISLALGFTFASIRQIPAVFAHFASFILGSGLILLQWSSVLPVEAGENHERIQLVLSHAGGWIGSVYGGGSPADAVMLVGALCVVIWIMGYLLPWWVYRTHRVWPALAYPAIAFISNASYMREPSKFYFVMLVIGGIVLYARMNAYKNEVRWRQSGINYSPFLIWRLMWSGFVVCAAVLLLANFVPVTKAGDDPLAGVWKSVATPFYSLGREWTGFWPYGPGPSRAFTRNTSYTNFSSSFQLGGNIRLGDGIVLQEKADVATYLQAMSYDTYTGRGWLNTVDQTFKGRDGKAPLSIPTASSPEPKQLSPLLSLPADAQVSNQYQLRKPVTQTITLVNPNSDAVIAASDISSVSGPTNLVPSWHWRSYEQLHVLSIASDKVPRELRTLVGLLRNDDGTPRLPLDIGAVRTEMDHLAGKGITVSRMVYSADKGVTGFNASGFFAEYDDVTSVRFQNKPKAGSTYTVVSSVADPDKASLRLAGEDYPEWVKDRYLQLPGTVPDRIKQLAETVTAGKTTVYDKAVAIEAYLRTYQYAESISPAPEGRDAVDYFLFDSKTGYCEYFSSSMVVMLRSLGIPAREVTGFSAGQLDETSGLYTIREKNAHAWPQVYFPNYGWIDFEPTSARPAIIRPEGADTVTTATDPTTNSDPMRDIPRFSFGQQPQASTTQSSALDSVGAVVASKPFQVSAGLLGFAAVGLVTLFVIWQFGLRNLASVSLAYARLCRAAVWLGLSDSESRTPYEHAESLSEALPRAHRSIRRISDTYVAQVYGGKQAQRSGDGASASADLDAEWKRMRPQFLKEFCRHPWGILRGKGANQENKNR